MPMDRAAVRAHLEETGCESLWLIFHDYNGRACARAVPRAGFARALDQGTIFAHANLDFAFGDQQATDAAWRADSGDWRAVPDPASFAVVPYREHTARLHVYMRQEDGAPWDGCPRMRLERVLEAYALQGWGVQAGFEPEFTLFTPAGAGEYRPADHDPMYSLAGLDRHAALAGRILAVLPAMGVTVEGFGKEYGAGQYELNIRGADPVQAADDYLTLKAAVHALAREAGWVASFMPKPYAHLAGNGLHVHLSLWDATGARELSRGRSDAEILAPLGRHFLGGLLAHAPALCGLGASTVNSYKRLLPHSWAPAHVCWGVGNRAALVRVPGPGARRHLEFRAGDNAGNPFLFLTALLAAGLDGIRQALGPPPPVSDDVGRLPAAEAAARGLAFLPRSLPEALAAVESDPVVAEALGPVILPAWLRLKRTELAAYDQTVHPWERAMYLETI